MLLLFLTLVSADIVVFERYKTFGCTLPQFNRIEPWSVPVPNLRYAAQTATLQFGADNRLAGSFASVNETTVVFQYPAGQLESYAVNGECIRHPAFGDGRFITVPGPIIASIERRNGNAGYGPPRPDICGDPAQRDLHTWYALGFPITTITFNSSACPQNGKYFYTQNGNIASLEFGKTQSPFGKGCFDDNDPLISSCINNDITRRFCTAEASCSVPYITNPELDLDPFDPSEYASVESIRVISTNVFPFDNLGSTPTTPTATTLQGQTTPSPTTTSAGTRTSFLSITLIVCSFFLWL